MLTRAVGAFTNQEVPPEEGLRWLPLACKMAHDVWDAGEFAMAESLAEETEAVNEVTRSDLAPYGILLLAAWRGQEHETTELIEAARKEIVARGEGQWLTAAHGATAVLYNGLGRFEEARIAAEQAREYPPELGLSNWALIELIEAAARSGKPRCAADTVQRLSAPYRSARAASQEEQIARLARDGLSNPEIGARLFISPRTSNGTCAKCSPSSGSAPAWASTPALPSRDRQAAPA